MTPDLDEIRAALATAKTVEYLPLQPWIYKAPTWLAALVEEVERLRAEVKAQFDAFPLCSLSMQGGECSAEDRWKEVVANVVAERDAALAEIERLRSMYEIDEKHIVRVAAERDAALAENEKLRSAPRRVQHMVMTDMWEAAVADGEAWRACAEQLATSVRQVATSWWHGDPPGLDMYERLRSGATELAPDA